VGGIDVGLAFAGVDEEVEVGSVSVGSISRGSVVVASIVVVVGSIVVVVDSSVEVGGLDVDVVGMVVDVVLDEEVVELVDVGVWAGRSGDDGPDEPLRTLAAAAVAPPATSTLRAR
jgi:hypothetical protein